MPSKNWKEEWNGRRLRIALGGRKKAGENANGNALTREEEREQRRGWFD